uniref:(northern house mosquito) hypothetical protein n=1 Tax=Culex pipiens TaxID=7175 RepID=A0A8D8FB54_CULPI
MTAIFFIGIDTSRHRSRFGHQELPATATRPISSPVAFCGANFGPCCAQVTFFVASQLPRSGKPTRSRVADHSVGQSCLQPVAGFKGLAKSQRSFDDVPE